MSEYFTVANVVHLFLLVGACGLCYLWGKIQGAVELAIELINYKLITVEQLNQVNNDSDKNS